MRILLRFGICICLKINRLNPRRGVCSIMIKLQILRKRHQKTSKLPSRREDCLDARDKNSAINCPIKTRTCSHFLAKCSLARDLKINNIYPALKAIIPPTAPLRFLRSRKRRSEKPKEGKSKPRVVRTDFRPKTYRVLGFSYLAHEDHFI